MGLFCLSFFMAVGGVYSTNLMSVLMPIIALALLWNQGGIKNLSLHMPPPVVCLLLLIMWAGGSFFWAQAPSAAIKSFGASCLTFIFFMILLSTLMEATPEIISKAYTLLLTAGLILMFLITFQLIADEFHINFFNKQKDAPYMMKPSGSIIGMGVFISCGFLWIYKNRVLSIVSFFLLVVFIYLTLCQTAWYGILLASLVFCMSYYLPLWTTRMAMFLSGSFVLLSPFLCLHVFPLSMLARLKWVIGNASLFHRMLAWDFLSEKFLERPLVGWGLESTRYLQTEFELAEGYSRVIHPHSNSIQAYVELGMVGGVLFAFLFVSLFWLVEKHVRDRLSVAVCNATLTFGFTQAEVTHNLWHNYWLSWTALIVGFLIVFLKAREAQLRAEADHLMPLPASREG